MFCKNVKNLEVSKIRSPRAEIEKPDMEDFAMEFYDPESECQWYVASRAVEKFREANSGRYPGPSDEAAVKALMDEYMKAVQTMNESASADGNYAYEICRFEDGKQHSVASVLGGIASQEAVKLLIRQYTPVNHTMVFNGIKTSGGNFNL